MARNFVLVLLLAVFVLTGRGAQAYYAAWSDPQTHVGMNVPDTWQRGNNQGAFDLVTFLAPGNNEWASCRVSMQPYSRFTVYPVDFSENIRNIHMGDAFWDAYAAASYRSYSVNALHHDVGLGNGYGGYADISYVLHDLNAHMRGIVFATVYANHLYTWECAAQESAFEALLPTFRSILATVTMPKRYHELPGGYYRHFIADPVLEVTTINDQTSRH